MTLPERPVWEESRGQEQSLEGGLTLPLVLIQHHGCSGCVLSLQERSYCCR